MPVLSWTLVSEYLALIFIATIMYFYYDDQAVTTRRRRLYWCCLILSAAAIVLDILTVWLDQSEEMVPLSLNLTVNTVYFLTSIDMTVMHTQYLLMRVYEHVPNKRRRKVANIVLALLGALFMGLLVANIWTGWFFSFSKLGDYVRGPFNRTIYVLPVAEMLLIVICYLRNRACAGAALKKIVKCLPPIVLLLLMFQMMFPAQLLNGTFSAVLDLVIFMNFQSVRVEVDPLTELGNRSGFAIELEHRMKAGQDCQVVLIGLRSFSEINGVYGHEGGDSVLFQVARRLEKAAHGGVAYRFGGDEFIVILPYHGSEEREERILGLQDAMKEPWAIGDHEVRIGAVMAELLYLDNGWKIESIVNRLEFSLAVAKQKNVEVLRFDRDMSRRYAKRKKVLNSMKTAMEEGRFEAWFQPLYSTASREFDTAEALVRMRDEAGKLISPAEFVPLAEKSEVIDDLTWVVVHGACDLLQSGAVPGLRYISVNLTARQLLQTGITKRLMALLAEHGVEPAQIKLEITERMVTENGALVASVMQEMRDCGFEFMMDDFGTGYSNLSSTLSMPFTYVKLDKSLIDGICEDKDSALMVGTLIPFFHKVGEKVVAEGIETREQAEAAIAYGADRLQGFYYAKPMPADEFCAWHAAKEREAEER